MHSACSLNATVTKANAEEIETFQAPAYFLDVIVNKMNPAGRKKRSQERNESGKLSQYGGK